LVKDVLVDAWGWFQDYGFELNSREWAALIWLGIFVTFVFLNPTVRASLRHVLRSAVTPKLAVVWGVYLAWIAAFVALAHLVGVWRIALTKDTILWAVTGGLASIAGFTKAKAAEPGYFGRAVLKAVGVVVFLEYLSTLATFRLSVELVLQPMLLLFSVAPIVAREPRQRTSWQRASRCFFAILMLAIVGYTARTILASRAAMDWALFALQATWPMALALWVLVLVFGLVVVSSYERAFHRLELSRSEPAGGWKPKLGLMLALGLKLRWIHEAAKGRTLHAPALSQCAVLTRQQAAS